MGQEWLLRYHLAKALDDLRIAQADLRQLQPLQPLPVIQTPLQQLVQQLLADSQRSIDVPNL
jgi:hypothetical protein